MVNDILRKYNVEKIYREIDKEDYDKETIRAFMLLDNSKDLGLYSPANKVFAFLAYREDVEWGIEVDEKEQEDMDIHKCACKNDIYNYHYHSLMTLRYKDYYACIPLPMLSSYMVKICLGAVDRPVNRLDHSRSNKKPKYIWTENDWDFFNKLNVKNFFSEQPYMECRYCESHEIENPVIYRMNSGCVHTINEDTEFEKSSWAYEIWHFHHE